MNQVRALHVRQPRLQRRQETRTIAPAASATSQLQRRVGNGACQPLISTSSSGAPQFRLSISSPGDSAEREAESVGRHIARMPAPNFAPAVQAAPVALARSPLIRSGSAPALLARAPKNATAPQAQPQALAGVTAEILAAQTDGQPMPEKLRRFMEPRFNANFSGVKIHTDQRAARLARETGAQAFTVGGNIFFGQGQFQPDTEAGRELIAHELTHTIQQGAARQSAAAPAATTRTRSAPQLSRTPQIQTGSSANTIARASTHRVRDSLPRWLRAVLDFFADKARIIPGYTLLTVLLAFNPISLRDVPRTGVNILRGLVELIPIAGPMMVRVLENNGLLARAGEVAERQFASMRGAVDRFTNNFDTFLDSLGPASVFSFMATWERAKALLGEPIRAFTNAGWALVGVVTDLIKQAVLQPLARMAQSTRAWDLLCAVLGSNPITGAAVQRSPQVLIGGFMRLIGQEEVWQNIVRANALPRAWAWFQSAISGAIALVTSLPQRFLSALQSLRLEDLLTVVGAYLKIVRVFASFVVDFLVWGGNAVWELLKIIFEVVAPGAMPYLRKVGASLREIFKNPLPFVRNLARAGVLGFRQFMSRFGTHLKAGIIQWLTGSLPGVHIPQALNLQEIVKFVLSVLGISWTAFRVKLVRAIGERAVEVLETTFDVVRILVTQGPAAAWDKIKEHLTNLKDMVIDGIKDFIFTTVITRATAKIASLMIPGAGFISAIVSIWDMMQVFLSQLQRIIAVGRSFLDSVMDIASGAIGNAANRVETTLANLLTLAINFLAGFVGLGGLAGRVMNLINTRIRPPIDRAMDKLVEWIVRAGRAVVSALSPRRAGTDAQAAAPNLNAMAIEQVLNMPPSTGERGLPQKTAELQQAEELLRRIVANSEDTAQVEDYFPRVKARFRLRDISYVLTGPGKIGILATVNPMIPTGAGTLKLRNLRKKVDGFKTEVNWTTMMLDTVMVGKKMEAKRLGPEHPQGEGPIGNVHKKLMEQLDTTTSNNNEDKYIRGHLLNDNLGGPGQAGNLFPITANANKEHLLRVEEQVKDWVNKKFLWVYYKVEITPTAVVLGGISNKANNKVNCTMYCEASVLAADGITKTQGISATITSEKTVSHNAPPPTPTGTLPLPTATAAASGTKVLEAKK